MFALARSPFGRFEKIDIADPETGHGFTVCPAPGATLTSLRLRGLEMLDGYQTPEELEAYKWSKSAVLMPFPNRLRDGKMPWLGKELDWPINNRDTGNSIHGYLRERDFEVVEIKLGPKTASIRLRYKETGHYEPFPFPFRFEVVYTMKKRGPTGLFSVTFLCKNTGRQPMPVGFGWHPYFRIGEAGADESSLRLPECERVVVDSRMLPTGKREAFDQFGKQRPLAGESLDTCFFSTESGKWAVKLFTKHGLLEMAADREKWPFFQVFTPPHRQSVAIEPMSCNVDAHHNGEGLVRLEPGEIWRGSFDVGLFKKPVAGIRALLGQAPPSTP